MSKSNIPPTHTAAATTATPSTAIVGSDGAHHKKKGKMTFFYDPETRTCLGRTCLSWFKISIFYVIFYFFLGALLSASLHILLIFVPQDRPVFTGSEFGCTVGLSQSIGVRPKSPLTAYERSNKLDHLRSTIIWVKEGNDDNAKAYIQDLTQVMAAEDNLKKCKDNSGCKVYDTDSDWGECGKPDKNDDPEAFGYKVGRPCIMIRLNRLFNWEPSKNQIPEYYADEPERRQKETFRNYLNWRDENKEVVQAAYGLDISKSNEYVWINCRGETRTDDANIGSIQYFPKPGIPISYFPFRGNVKNWASPYVMVQFQNIRRGVLVNVRCEAYNTNIEARTGVVKFGVMVDPK